MKEQPKHIDAFHYYFALTEKGYSITDSVKATADHCNVTIRTLWKWYKEFNWEEKSDIKRAKIMKELEKKENKTLAENRATYLNIVHKELDDLIKNDFPAKITTIGDLEKIIKLALLLQNSPTEVVKNDNINYNIDTESLFDEEKMRKILLEEEKNAKRKEQEEILEAETEETIEEDIQEEEDDGE